MAKTNQIELERWRSIDASDVISKFADYAKCDETYVPIRNEKSKRWNVTVLETGEYEIIATGPKWYDTRARRGGGGAVDLVMYLFHIDFLRAVAKIRGVL